MTYLASPKQLVVDLMSNGTHNLDLFSLCCDIDKFVFHVDHSYVARRCDINLYRVDKLRVRIECKLFPMWRDICRSEILIKDEVTGRRDLFCYTIVACYRPTKKSYYISIENYNLFDRHYYAVTRYSPHLFSYSSNDITLP